MSVLEFFSFRNLFELSCTRKLRFLVHGASPNARLFLFPETRFRQTHLLASSQFLQKFSGSFIVIYCLIINVLCCLVTAYLAYHILSAFVNNFLKVFLFFFFQVVVSLTTNVIIPLVFFNVNYIFRIFSNNLRNLI